jgi:hypothetical protein
LRASLQSRANNAHFAGVFPRQHARGNAARSAGAHLAKTIRFNQRHHFTRFCLEQWHEEAGSFVRNRVDLQAQVAAGNIRCGHVIQDGLSRDTQPLAAMENGGTIDQPPKGTLDRFECQRHGQNRFDVRFSQQQWHLALPKCKLIPQTRNIRS